MILLLFACEMTAIVANLSTLQIVSWMVSFWSRSRGPRPFTDDFAHFGIETTAEIVHILTLQEVCIPILSSRSRSRGPRLFADNFTNLACEHVGRIRARVMEQWVCFLFV